MVTDGLRALATGGNFATLTTLLPDGRPAAQVMWVDCDDDCVLINTELHRQKFKNVERDPRVVVCIWDKDDPYHYIEVRGDVVEIIRGEPARQHIDELAMRYFGRALRRRRDPERARHPAHPADVAHGRTAGRGD